MDTLTVLEVERYLALAEGVGQSCPVVDAHVHATEIIDRALAYRPAAEGGGMLSAVDRPFEPPHVSAVRLDGGLRRTAPRDARFRNQVSRVLYTTAYEHIGARVLREHMHLARVDQALLLPVAPAEGAVDDQMRTLAAIRAADARFEIAYSVPNVVRTEDVGRDLRTAVQEYGVRAVKLHPNLSRIDPRTTTGMERIEGIQDACRASALPLIVHGGRSPILGDDEAAGLAILDNLARVDWDRSGTSVVIAHCGFFGCDGDDIVGTALPALQGMLDRHAKVLVDTSGLSLGVLVEALRHLDDTRLVFGSDALYFPMWQSVVTLLHALKTAGRRVEESFARIACVNARTHLLPKAPSPG